MATTADERVEALFKIVQQKKAEIEIAERPNWITNCSFGFVQGSTAERMNIQVITDVTKFIEALAFLIEKESSYTKAAKELGLSSTFKWMGYTKEEWKTDFQTRINKLQISNKKKELEVLEKRLNSLVSPEMRREMELAEIEKELAI